MSLLKQYFFSCIVCFGLSGLVQSCTETKKESAKLTIVCTTGYAADLCKQLVDTSIEVIALMGPGVDPHLYKASLRDVELLSNADLIVYSGLHLEGKMVGILQKIAKTKAVICLADGLAETDLLQFGEAKDSHDPHFWFNASLWKKAGIHFANVYQKLNWEKPESLQKTLKSFVMLQDSLHEFARTQFLNVPQNKRILITAHDAFAYFSKAYGLKVKSLQGISTLSEYGVRDVAELVNYIVAYQIRSVFVESSIPKQSLYAVQEGCAKKNFKLNIGEELFSDALGAKNSPYGTYSGVFIHNVEAVKKGLSE